MAIFGKKDAALPLITQALQVDANNEKQVIRFMLRTLALASLYAVSNLKPKRNLKIEVDEGDGWIIADDGETYFLSSKEQDVPVMEEWAQDGLDRLLGDNEATNAIGVAQGYESGRQYLIHQFAMGLYHARRLFQSLYESNAVPMESLDFLRANFDAPNLLIPNMLDSALRSDIASALHQTPEEEKEKFHPIVPLDKFMPGEYFGNVLPGVFLGREVERLLLALWRNEKRLSECKECQSVFVEQRKGQRFCSARCSDRIAQRRKTRREKREERQSGKDLAFHAD